MYLKMAKFFRILIKIAPISCIVINIVIGLQIASFADEINYKSFDTQLGLIINYPESWFIKEYSDLAVKSDIHRKYKPIKKNLYWELFNVKPSTYFSIPEEERCDVIIDVFTLEAESRNDFISNFRNAHLKTIYSTEEIKVKDQEIKLYNAELQDAEGRYNVALFSLPSSEYGIIFLQDLSYNHSDDKGCTSFRDIIKRLEFGRLKVESIDILSSNKLHIYDYQWNHNIREYDLVQSGERKYNIVPKDHDPKDDPPIICYAGPNITFFNSMNKSPEYNLPTHIIFEGIATKPGNWIINVYNLDTNKLVGTITAENESYLPRNEWGDNMPEGKYYCHITVINPVSGSSMTWESNRIIEVDLTPPEIHARLLKTVADENDSKIEMFFSSNEYLSSCMVHVIKGDRNNPEHIEDRIFTTPALGKDETVTVTWEGAAYRPPGEYYFEIVAADVVENISKVYSRPFIIK